MVHRILTACLLIALLVPVTAGAAARLGTQPGGVAPTAIRIPQALVDTVIEPLAIVNAVPQITTNPWTVGWYHETGGLDVPGNPVLYGLVDWPEVGPAVFFLADQLRPGNAIDITGEDGYQYHYQVEWVESYPRPAAPIEDIFATPPSERLLTLFFDGAPFNARTGGYDNVVVVRARQTHTVPSPAPQDPVSTLSTTAGCPVAPRSLELPRSAQVYPYPVIAPYPYADRNQMGIPAAANAADDTVAALNALLGDATGCDVAVRAALQLPDGHVLALVGPAGTLPLQEVRHVVSVRDRGITDSTLANIAAFLLFVEEPDGWRYVPHPVG